MGNSVTRDGASPGILPPLAIVKPGEEEMRFPVFIAHEEAIHDCGIGPAVHLPVTLTRLNAVPTIPPIPGIVRVATGGEQACEVRALHVIQVAGAVAIVRVV